MLSQTRNNRVGSTFISLFYKFNKSQLMYLNIEASLAPTVMLNALAMKLELKPAYIPLNVAPAKVAQQQRNFGNFGGNNNNSANFNNHQYQPNYKHPNFYNNNNYTSFTSNDYKPFVYQPASNFASANHYNASMANNSKHHHDFRPLWNHPNAGFNRIQRPGFPNYTNNNNNAWQGFAPPQKCTVKLKFADQEFEGEGVTVQAARHNAAAKALEHFSQIENFNKAKQLAEAAKEAKEAALSKSTTESSSTKTDAVVSSSSQSNDSTTDELASKKEEPTGERILL
jgi:hypothetical protein